MSFTQTKSDLVDLDVIIVHRTERAVLIDDGDQEVWLALAHVEIELTGVNRNAQITIPEWLEIEKELV